MLSHQLKQGKIDGEKTIIQNPNEAQRKEHEKCEFALHEVYAIDVLISTGEGIVSKHLFIFYSKFFFGNSIMFTFSIIKIAGPRKRH